MKASRYEIHQLLTEQGVISERRHPLLARSLQGMASNATLARVLPGVYARPASVDLPWVRIRAVNLWDPHAVVSGRAAAFWTFWSELPVAKVDVAVGCERAPRRGYAFTRRKVPPELLQITSQVIHTCASLTVLDLVPELGGDAIDLALRKGVATLSALHEALAATPGRAGNTERAYLLRDSRDLPWSVSERLLHRLLRAHRFRGWTTNEEVWVDGQVFFADVMFRAMGVIVEVDGWEWHGRRMVDFQKTMHRHSLLEAAGWRVLHFTFFDVSQRPEWVLSIIRRAITLGR